MFIAKYIVAFVAVYGFGGVLFDAVLPATARQHLWNPAWPPHAKFHNGQTMAFGVFNGVLAVAVLFLFRPLTLPVFFVGVAVAASYWVTLLGAQFFPGTAWHDPEFAAVTPRPLGQNPQALVSYLLLGLLGVAVLLAVGLG